MPRKVRWAGGMAASLLLGALSAAGAPRAEEDAAAAYSAQRWEQAAAGYEQMVQQKPENGLAWFRLGTARIHLGRYQQAVAAFERCESLKFAPLYTSYNLAAAWARLGDKEKALGFLETSAARGFMQANQLEQDEDLASLRGEARFQQVLDKVRSNAEPCRAAPESRQFDFWIGEWAVETATGTPAGNSSVELILGTCVVFENWTGLSGYTGKSFNLYNVPKGKWQQYWVDSQGTVTTFEGAFDGKRMQLTGPTFPRSGEGGLRRMTFTALGPDRVRQMGETSSDEGKTWEPEYDLIYVRKKPAAPPSQ